MRHTPLSSAIAASLLAIGLSGCGSSDSETTPPPADTTVNVSGSVSAPGGLIAFNNSNALERFFGSIFGTSAVAAIEGVAPVGAGVTVNLIEVDANGTQVGAVIATATTDAMGAYSIAAPEGFVPGSQYIVRAEGTSGTIDARVTSLTPDVDPLSDASSTIISDQSMDLTKLSTTEADEIFAALEEVVQEIDPAGLSASQLVTELKTAANENDEISNVVASTVTTGQICGNVTDSTGAALENIRMIVRDFGNWVTRAKAKTDANGDYCINVPIAGDADPNISGSTLSGEYILGALNFTGTSMAASQWWTSTSTTTDGSGGANNQFVAGKISVPDTTTVTRNMVLDANGARIQGTVTGSDNTPLEGMKVLVRNYDTFKPLSGAKVKADGTYRVNVKAGDYMFNFRNKTRHPFASEVYRFENGSDTGGVNDRNMASRETLVAGMTYTYDAVLESGVVISGQLTNDLDTAISGQRVLINNSTGGRIAALRTNKQGKFRIWVKPILDVNVDVPYSIVTRGQILAADTNGVDNLTATKFSLKLGSGLLFNNPVATITGTLLGTDGSTPVSEAIVFIKEVTTDVGGAIISTGVSYNSVSDSEGNFTLNTDALGKYIIYTRMDSDINFGSGVYDGTAISAIPQIDANIIEITDLATPIALSNIMVPTLGSGAGVGYVVGTTEAGSTGVNFRIGGVGVLNALTGSQSRGDGSFKVSLPAATYGRFRSNGVNCDGVTVANGATVTVTYSGGVCTVE